MKTEKRLKILLLTAKDHEDKMAWSGTLYQMIKSLQKHCGDLYFIGPINTRVETLLRYLNDKSMHLFKKNYSYFHSILLSKTLERIIKRKLSTESFDIIFAPVASTELAFLDVQKPLVYLSDSTFKSLQNYYKGEMSNLLSISRWEGNFMEKSAIKKSDLILYPSRWAAESAVNDYGADESKIYIVPFGANIEEIPPKEVVVKKEKSKTCKLLFLGVDWYRKGGQIAFETLIELEKLGVQTELTVCGCIPPEDFKHKKMTVIPFLDKNDEKQRKELDKLFFESNFLLLPTRSEAYGMVFCEANAFGLPAITTETGGIPSVIDNGQNGFMLPMDAKGKDYARIISDIYRNDEVYNELIISSRETFDKKLNWDVWGKTVCKLMHELCSK